MANLEWQDSLPDSAGLWAKKLGNDGGMSVYPVTEKDLQCCRQSGGPWCRIGDLPVIHDPVKHLEPTLADIGTMVFVRQSSTDRWRQRRLLWIRDTVVDKFIVLNGDETVDFFNYAQIAKEPS